MEPPAEIHVLDAEVQTFPEVIVDIGGVPEEEVVLMITQDVAQDQLSPVPDLSEIRIDRHADPGEIDAEFLLVLLGRVAELLARTSSPIRSR
jgi:hypothetical protein